LTRSQASEIPKIEVTGDEGDREGPQQPRRGGQRRVSFPIPDPVQYVTRDENPDVLRVEIHREPEDPVNILPKVTNICNYKYL
jgi:hypothetical protein